MLTEPVNIGSNSQPVVVDLDTGSSELWVNPDCATANTPNEQAYCNSLPKYNPGTSTTSKNLGIQFNLQYGKGSASGTYYTDDITCGSATIKTQQFGVADTSQFMSNGILGVGLHTSQFNYPSVIENLAAQGKIKSVAFSLDLRSVNQPTGITTNMSASINPTTDIFQGPLSLAASILKSTIAICKRCLLFLQTNLLICFLGMSLTACGYSKYY